MQKRIYLGNGARSSNFDEIFDPQGICRVYWRLFAKIVFLPLLAAVLNFFVKHKNAFISETEQDRAPLLTAILNFCIKCKNVFISETERDRAISTKFLTRRVSAESTGDFSQKSFSRHFWQPF